VRIVKRRVFVFGGRAVDGKPIKDRRKSLPEYPSPSGKDAAPINSLSLRERVGERVVLFFSFIIAGSVTPPPVPLPQGEGGINEAIKALAGDLPLPQGEGEQ